MPYSRSFEAVESLAKSIGLSAGVNVVESIAIIKEKLPKYILY